MKQKEKIRNKKFKSVKEKLEFVQKSCLEPELFDDLKQLFKARGYQNVTITHGNTEFGKDLVFSKYDDDFNQELWYAVIVKNKPAKQNDFVSGGEIANQINLALNIPYKDNNSVEKKISKLFIVINGNVTANALEVISKSIDKSIMPYIKIWDYQELENQIETYTRESFLDNLEPHINTYVTEQVRILSDISIANSVYDLNVDDINEIFINVQTTFSKELKKMNNYVTFDNDDEIYIEEDIEGSNEIFQSGSNFIIHGIATSGKSIFLKRIGIKALNQTHIKQNAVFFFELQNYQNGKIDIEKMIEAQYSELTKGEKFLKVDYSKKLLLFDSIDFVKEDSAKVSILKTIEAFAENKDYQIIIATRDYDFLVSQGVLSSFKNTELLPFNFDQALKLVRKIIPNNQSKTNNFIKALKNSLLDTSIQRTPLALTLMAILYRDDKIDLKELPANIFELYNRFTDVYLDKWDSSKGITQLYQYEQKKNILAFIAFHLHKLGLNSIHEDELRHFLTELRKQYNYEDLNSPERIEEYIQHLKIKNGVFYYDGINQSFSFFNHYFQEYFASLCIEDEDEEILIDNFFNSWWSNAIVFYCGKNNKSFKLHREIINNIIPVGSGQKLHYVNQHSKCLQASHSISIQNRTKIIQKLLVEFDNIFREFYSEGITDVNSFINQIPFVNVMNQSKTIFESIFNSKHIATEETLKLFEDVLNGDGQLSNITYYNIAYFLAFHKNSGKPFEIFANKIEADIVWNRILYVDINFLKLKKKVDEKQFLRFKRKMNKNKFQIQDLLKQTLVAKQLKEDLKDDNIQGAEIIEV